MGEKRLGSLEPLWREVWREERMWVSRRTINWSWDGSGQGEGERREERERRRQVRTGLCW